MLDKSVSKKASFAANHIVLHGVLVPYVVKNARRARSIRLTMYPDRGLVVTKGRSVRKEFAEAFIQEKAEWILETIAHFDSLPKDIASFTTADIARYKKEALVLVERLLKKYIPIYGFPYNRVSIRDQKTRWGSCSPTKNLQFNYRIALLPLHLAEYLVVHEVCHLAQMNHSKKFWDLVAKTIPDYAKCRKELRAKPLQQTSPLQSP